MYLDSLGLSDRRLYDAIGDHFDRAVVPVQLAGLLGRRLRDGDLPLHEYLSLPSVERGYQRIRGH
eukprot:6626266-Lingulodinium_polyedra.AAC.1